MAVETVYKTSDNQYFQDKDKAEKHENAIFYKEEIHHIICENWEVHSTDEDDVLRIILDNKRKIHNALSKIIEIEPTL